MNKIINLVIHICVSNLILISAVGSFAFMFDNTYDTLSILIISILLLNVFGFLFFFAYKRMVYILNMDKDSKDFFFIPVWLGISLLFFIGVGSAFEIPWNNSLEISKNIGAYFAYFLPYYFFIRPNSHKIAEKALNAVDGIGLIVFVATNWMIINYFRSIL